MVRPLVALGLALGVTLLACGGTVILPDQSSSSSSGGSTSSGGTSSGGGSTTSSGGTSGVDEPCYAQTLPGDRVCVRRARPRGQV